MTAASPLAPAGGVPAAAAQPGHFYAVGAGPGAPDLLTLRALHLIRTADVLIAPRSEKAEASLVLQSLKSLLTSRQEVLTHVYPMERDAAKTRASWTEVATQVVARCQAGQSVVQVTLGDPLIYSTSAYLLAALAERLPAERLHVVPGISAFQAAASRFGAPLTVQEDRLLIMPATDLAEVEAALGRCETLVLYKAGRKLAALADLLERRGLLERARLVCNVEQGAREYRGADLRAAADGRHGYLATVIIQVGRRGWGTETG